MKTLQGVISAFISTRKLKNLSPHTIEFYRHILRKFLSFIDSHRPDIPLDMIDHHILRRYIANLQERHSLGGVNHHIKVLKILFKFMVEEGMVSENPSKKISRLKVGQTVIPTFTNDQIKAMLEVTKGQQGFPGLRNNTLITLLFDTGCRISEVLNLQLKDILLDEKILNVTGKGGWGRVVPFGQRSLITLVKYLDTRNRLFGEGGFLFLTRSGRQLSMRMADKTIERIGRKAEVKDVRLSAHTFRHTFAKNWLMNGGDIFSLQKILGHSTLEMVRNYVNMTFRDIQTQHRKFSPGDNILK